MLCEEQIRLLNAYVRATDRQAEAVRALSAVAFKDNRADFRKALAHAAQTRQDGGGGTIGVATAFKNSWLLNSVPTLKHAP